MWDGQLFQERKSDESMCTFVCHVLAYTLLAMFVLCILHAWSRVSRGIVMSFKHLNDGFFSPNTSVLTTYEMCKVHLKCTYIHTQSTQV